MSDPGGPPLFVAFRLQNVAAFGFCDNSRQKKNSLAIIPFHEENVIPTRVRLQKEGAAVGRSSHRNWILLVNIEHADPGIQVAGFSVAEKEPDYTSK